MDSIFLAHLLFDFNFSSYRIETILDSDRVLVMDGGKIAEFDSPKNLLSDITSLFYSLVNGKH